MSPTGPPDENHPKNSSMPRWQALILSFLAWFIGVPLVHGVLPWAVSFLTPRFGWASNRPGLWNLLGLVPVILGSACLVWVMVHHISRTPERVRLEATPSYLLERGPYRFSRNPMYVAELGLWLGWAILYGSIAVLIGALLLWVAMNYRGIPREERNLEGRFGESYQKYKNRVPRWLGKTRHHLRLL